MSADKIDTLTELVKQKMPGAKIYVFSSTQTDVVIVSDDFQGIEDRLHFIGISVEGVTIHCYTQSEFDETMKPNLSLER